MLKPELSDLDRYYVYQLVDPLTELPFYVGKGCGDRMYKHEKDVLRGTVPNKTNFDLSKRIKEIHSRGSNVIHEKLCDETQELTSLALEAAFIDHYGIDNLCNYTRGWFGDSYRNDETRRRQSVAHKGSRSYMFGVKKTEEQKQKNRLAHMGKNNSRYDHTVYKFYNFSLNLVEESTQFEFRKKYQIESGGLHRLISGKRGSVNGWTLGRSLEDIELERREKIRTFHSGRSKSESHCKNLWKNRPRKSSKC